MSRDDLPSSGASTPEEDHSTLPLIERTFQPTFAEQHGQETSPSADLESRQQQETASAAGAHHNLGVALKASGDLGGEKLTRS